MEDGKTTFGVLKKHKNMLLQCIQEAELDPQDFSGKEEQTNGDTWFELKYKDTPLWYAVKRHEHDYGLGYVFKTLFKPGLPRAAPSPMAWQHVEQDFSIWLETDLKEYLNEVNGPDLWAQIPSQKPVVSDAPVGSDDREQFTKTEQDQLQMSIKEFRQIIIEKHSPNDDQLKLIDDRLDYLSEQVSKLNRINWRSLALATLIAVIIQLTLSTEQGKELFELGQRIFSNVVLLLQ